MFLPIYSTSTRTGQNSLHVMSDKGTMRRQLSTPRLCHEVNPLKPILQIPFSNIKAVGKVASKKRLNRWTGKTRTPYLILIKNQIPIEIKMKWCHKIELLKILFIIHPKIPYKVNILIQRTDTTRQLNLPIRIETRRKCIFVSFFKKRHISIR